LMQIRGFEISWITGSTKVEDVIQYILDHYPLTPLPLGWVTF
jgi:hypothetical protein